MNKSFIISVLIIILLLILAIMYPNVKIRYNTAAICCALWFILGYKEGKKK